MGKLFVIEGTDGSGKQTQLQKLVEKFTENKIDFKTVSFPNYDSPSSSLVKMYLSGEFGENPKDVSPYVASTFYAADRFATFKKDFEKPYNDGTVILADRYTTANMVHQAGKISDLAEREKFLDWLFDLEYGIYGLPKPTEVFFLNMPPEKAEELMKNRINKFSHEEKKDIHERNPKHIEESYKAACSLVNKFKCVNKDNEIRSIDDIHEEIYNEVLRHIK